MKKSTILLFIVAIANNIIYKMHASHEIYFEQTSSLKKNNFFHHPTWPKPYTYAKRVLKKEEPIPTGYMITEIFNEGTLEEKKEVEKKLCSGRHEYWNQFIEGYEPKEEFEYRMQTLKPFNPLKETALDDIEKRAEFRHSAKYQVTIKNKLQQLAKIETEKANMPSLSKKHQAKDSI